MSSMHQYIESQTSDKRSGGEDYSGNWTWADHREAVNPPENEKGSRNSNIETERFLTVQI